MPIEIEVTEAAPPDPRAEQSMVPMRDGVRLATDVFLPPDSQTRIPAVLVRLPYDKGGRYTFMSDIAPSFTDRGYAFVVQDVRGKFRSEGETLAFAHEVDDGYDTLEWVVSQPWCDGNVGMWGDSYYGYTQWAAVASRHPALKAIVRDDLSGIRAAYEPRRVPPHIASWVDGVLTAVDLDVSVAADG